jgi:hypothetical protein
MSSNVQTTDKIVAKGTVTRQLLDTKKYEAALKAFSEGNESLGKYLLNCAKKPMFQNNRLWKLIKNRFNLDLKIPYVTGFWTTTAITTNLVTTRGKRIIAEQLNGVSTAPVTAIAIGTGTTSPAAGNTALETEATTNGAQRGAATATNQTTTTTGDTMRLVKSFSLTGSFALTEEGLFDNNTSGGNMLARNTFSAVNVVSGDTFQVTHNIQLT